MDSHKDLVVWQKSMELVGEIYRATRSFPKEEFYGLISQIRRAAVSIPSNIAEGAARGHRAEYTQFISIALGSVAELETQILLASQLGFLPETEKILLLQRIDEVIRMLRRLRFVLKNKR